MEVEDVLRCSFPSWYPQFKKITIKSEILKIPPEVLEYLRSDSGLILPVECGGGGGGNPRKAKENEEDVLEESGDLDWDFQDVDNDEEDRLKAPSFPEFSASLEEALAKLNDSAFIKCNWSSPKDASWIALGNSLRSSSLSQIYLLFKSSEFISHDLNFPFKDCADKEEVVNFADFHLVLREWTEINPGSEFRVFVRNRRLVGVCQRDQTHFYAYIEKDRESILRDVKSFFHEHIDNKFPLKNYVFDVFRSSKDKVTLVDFNPYGERTDGLFFDWTEEPLNTSQDDEEDEIEFRYLKENTGIQPNSVRQYSLPRDFVDLSTGNDPDKLIDFLKLQTVTNK